MQTRRGAEEFERQLRQSLLEGSYGKTLASAPTLREFGPLFIEGYAKANRQKHSGVTSKESILRVHLYPRLGDKRLDQITHGDVQTLKGALGTKQPKTVNNVLTVLAKLLKVAVEWGSAGGGINALPVNIRLLKVAPPTMPFYEDEVFRDLVAAARAVGPETELIALLGGDAGLRAGEMNALEWSDIDLRRRQLHVRRAVWRGVVGLPKGGKPRLVPITERLTAALTAYRHLRGPRVLYREGVTKDGTPELFTQKTLQVRMEAAQRRAVMEVDGKLHVLRHTFCSRLAMAGIPARAIQELAGHANITTTQRYMHLAPAAKDAAIAALDALENRQGHGPGTAQAAAPKEEPQ